MRDTLQHWSCYITLLAYFSDITSDIGLLTAHIKCASGILSCLLFIGMKSQYRSASSLTDCVYYGCIMERRYIAYDHLACSTQLAYNCISRMVNVRTKYYQGARSTLLYGTLRELPSFHNNASPAWLGFLSASECSRLQAIINKTVRYGFLPTHSPSLTDLFQSADTMFFINYSHLLLCSLTTISITSKHTANHIHLHRKKEFH